MRFEFRFAEDWNQEISMLSGSLWQFLTSLEVESTFVLEGSESARLVVPSLS